MPSYLRRSPSLLLVSVAACALAACNMEGAAALSSTAHAPNVPPPIHRRSPATIRVELNASTQTISLANGVLYSAWTFGGSVPGPFIRALDMAEEGRAGVAVAVADNGDYTLQGFSDSAVSSLTIRVSDYAALLSLVRNSYAGRLVDILDILTA